jgi:hypothetical protein
MIRNYLLLFALFCTFSLQAQFGVQLSANFNQASDVFVPGIGEVESDRFDVGKEIALNYWFRLPKQRIEFLPTLFYATANIEGTKTGLKEYGAQLKVNIYPFDFLGDCDCPTFGKQGPQLQKGLFLQLAGGYSLYHSEAFVATPSFENGSGLTIGGGIGLDVGLSNLVTLTPIAGIRFGTSPYDNRPFTDVVGDESDIDGPKLTTFQAGLQVSFRLDHKKY